MSGMRNRSDVQQSAGGVLIRGASRLGAMQWRDRASLIRRLNSASINLLKQAMKHKASASGCARSCSASGLPPTTHFSSVKSSTSTAPDRHADLEKEILLAMLLGR